MLGIISSWPLSQLFSPFLLGACPYHLYRMAPAIKAQAVLETADHPVLFPPPPLSCPSYFPVLQPLTPRTPANELVHHCLMPFVWESLCKPQTRINTTVCLTQIQSVGMLRSSRQVRAHGTLPPHCCIVQQATLSFPAALHTCQELHITQAFFKCSQNIIQACKGMKSIIMLQRR